MIDMPVKGCSDQRTDRCAHFTLNAGILVGETKSAMC